jgi:hypothetical protein
MKRLTNVMLAAVLAASAAGCGGNPGGSGADGGQGGANAEEVAADLMEDAAQDNAFSEAAANAWLKAMAGLGKDEIGPDFAYRIDESLMTTYGDNPDDGYGHASIMFIAEDGELTEDEWLAWMRKAFDATAAASDDGHNVYGFEGDSDNPDREIPFEEAMGIGSDALIVMQGWGYKVGGTYMHVYVEQVEDPDRESEAETVDGELTLTYHYYAGSVDIAVGLQQSFDDTLSDAEDALEEHGDEIKDVLEDYGD